MTPAKPTPAALLARADALRVEADATERAALEAALESTAGNQSAAAKLLGMSLSTFTRRLTAAGFTADAMRDRWPLAGRQPRH